MPCEESGWCTVVSHRETRDTSGPKKDDDGKAHGRGRRMSVSAPSRFTLTLSHRHIHVHPCNPFMCVYIYKRPSDAFASRAIHTHTHTYIYIYISHLSAMRSPFVICRRFVLGRVMKKTNRREASSRGKVTRKEDVHGKAGEFRAPRCLGESRHGKRPD